MTRRAALGPWLKLYGDVVERKAHYSNEQFRALIEAWAWGLRGSPRGTLPRRAAVEARLGRQNADFLFSEGDLIEDDGAVSIVGWDVYQSGVLSTPRVQGTRGQRVDNGSPTVPEQLWNTGSLPLLSTSTENDEEVRAVAVNGADRDSLDRFHELTGIFPWGKASGRWLQDLEGKHGRANVLAALEVESKDGVDNGLIGRTAKRLGKQADRVEQAAERTKHKAKEPSPEEAAFKAALAATGRYDAPVNGSRGGAMSKVGDMVKSISDGSATSPVSAEGRLSDPAAGAVEANSFAPTSGPTPDGGRPPNPDGQG